MVVVTGASGFVGGALVRALLEREIPVRALVRRDVKALEGLEVEFVEGDITKPDSLREAFRGAEAVFHFAGSISLEMANWNQMEAINVAGTRHVVEACLGCDVPRLIMCSSIHALEQKPFGIPVDENRPRIKSMKYPAYDRSKAAAEEEVEAGISKGLDAVILNPTGIIGPYDFKPSYVGQSIVQLSRGEIPVLVGGGFDWVDVRDAAEGAVEAWQKAPKGRRYILSGHWKSVRDVARQVARETGRPAPVFVVPLWLAMLAAPVIFQISRLNGKHPFYTRASLEALRSNRNILHDRAARELGYAPRKFEDTIQDTIRWFRQQGQIPY